jgi:hypothetical protein
MESIITLYIDPNHKYDFKKEIYEPFNIYLQRIKFVLIALDCNIDIIQAMTLGHVYRNKILYNVQYTNEIENLVIKICSQDEFK